MGREVQLQPLGREGRGIFPLPIDDNLVVLVSSIRLFRKGLTHATASALSLISIEAADQDRTAVTVQPGLNAVAHMSRTIDPRIHIMRNADVLPFSISNDIGPTFQRQHMADY